MSIIFVTSKPTGTLFATPIADFPNNWEVKLGDELVIDHCDVNIAWLPLVGWWQVMIIAVGVEADSIQPKIASHKDLDTAFQLALGEWTRGVDQWGQCLGIDPACGCEDCDNGSGLPDDGYDHS